MDENPKAEETASTYLMWEEPPWETLVSKNSDREELELCIYNCGIRVNDKITKTVKK